MNCPNCGAYISDSTRFCSRCGTDVHKPTKPSRRAAQAKPSQTSSVVKPSDIAGRVQEAVKQAASAINPSDIASQVQEAVKQATDAVQRFVEGEQEPPEPPHPPQSEQAEREQELSQPSYQPQSQPQPQQSEVSGRRPTPSYTSHTKPPHENNYSAVSIFALILVLVPIIIGIVIATSNDPDPPYDSEGFESESAYVETSDFFLSAPENWTNITSDNFPIIEKNDQSLRLIFLQTEAQSVDPLSTASLYNFFALPPGDAASNWLEGNGYQLTDSNEEPMDIPLAEGLTGYYKATTLVKTDDEEQVYGSLYRILSPNGYCSLTMAVLWEDPIPKEEVSALGAAWYDYTTEIQNVMLGFFFNHDYPPDEESEDVETGAQ